MKKFMDKDFLLSTDTAKKLYHEYAESLPIIDYHCHINPKEIAEDIHFENITQVWLGADHYKWRYMRSCGVEEKYITGNASDEEKFFKWAEVLGKAIGNPLFHWSHLELQRYFGYTGVLNKDTAKEVWDLCNKKLSDPAMSARTLIKQSKVTCLCTTDDPIDSLEWHKIIKDDASFDVQVLPAWRPDKAMCIEKPEFVDYIHSLEKASGISINSFSDLKKALSNRMDFFSQNGCVISDHGMDYVMYYPASDGEIEGIFAARLNGKNVSTIEALKFKTAFMLFEGKECCKRNWVMQLHYGVKRNNNTFMFNKVGPDTGFDCISNYTPATMLTDFLNALAATEELPKTILYSLNPIDNQAIDSIIGCFQNEKAISYVQHGSAWWFNDHKPGMTDQLTSLASQGNLSGFVGMLTDSRSFLSYTRHEYFRRILCNWMGDLVENGEYPEDYDSLKEIVEGISYYNAVKYFGFNL